MDVLVVRHAIAEDREAFGRSGRPDRERPLTADGRRKFERGVRGLRRLVKEIDLVATSVLARAVETGRILSDAYGGVLTVRLAELAPEAEPSALLGWLGRQRRRRTVALVGHEPHLSALVELLVAGEPSGFLTLKKGGACLLSLRGRASARRAELRWLLTAGQLRRLGAG